MVGVATTIIMSDWIIGAIQSPRTGWDFPVFYIAAHLPMHLLYNSAAFAAFWQKHLAPIGVPHWAPYVRLSVFSLLLRPLAMMSYYHALWVWLSAGLSAYFASVFLLLRRFKLPALLIPAYAAFFPAIAGLIGGADATVYLLCLVVALLLLERGQDGLAGCALIPCLCKYNLVLLVPVVLLLHRRYRALVSFGIGAVLVVAISIALASPKSYIDAVANAPRIAGWFFPVGLRGFSMGIHQLWTYPILAILTFLLCWWLMRLLPLSEAFCVAIIGALLISPYITWYDSTLLVLPLAVILAKSGTAIRIICVGVLVAIPLWQYGGGATGSAGYMHVSVELFTLGFFIHASGLTRFL